jgi:serine/threonine protein kinase
MQGQSLFAQDIANDSLVDARDKTVLCAWHTIGDADLDKVFAAADPPPSARLLADAKNLIRWCLDGDPAKRPTFAQILQHRALDRTADAPLARPMKFHGFISHSQVSREGVHAVHISESRTRPIAPIFLR